MATLLKGVALSWKKFEHHKAGSIHLKTAGQRRLCRFLLQQPAARLTAPDQALFQGVIAAWNDKADPKDESADGGGATSAGSWRLARLEASGFGGLTVFGGPIFDVWINRENWCLEGQNGSGKTSFTNAILWALTGQRLREQDGLVTDKGDRVPVYSDTGAELGTWPPLISYPEKAADLKADAKVWVRLTFDNGMGEVATAYRETTSPAKGEPQTLSNVDSRLVVVPQLLETGLLMPARLPSIGFGSKSQSLYGAVKLLTGLDLLADVSEAARLLTHGAQPFRKYAKLNGIDQEALKFNENIEEAEKKADTTGINISSLRLLGTKDLSSSLRNLARSASAKAGEHIATLKAEIADGLDTGKSEVRTRIKQAVSGARAVLNQRGKGVSTFEAWTSLEAAKDDASFKTLPTVVEAAKAELAISLGWHKRQSEDQKLRLKALAAQYYVVPEADGFGVCPLCLADLTSAQQLALNAELAELREHAAAAERKLGDVCATLEKQLTTVLTPGLHTHRDLLATMEPKGAYAGVVRECFVEQEPFKSTLTGIAKNIPSLITEQEDALPSFVYVQPTPDATSPDAALDVLKLIGRLERLNALVAWWSERGEAFRGAWKALLEEKDGDGAYLQKTIWAQLDQLELAIEKSEPLDEIAKNLNSAADAADAWDKIQEHQAIRDAISEALEPLKSLRLLVDAETAASIAGLSGRIEEILARIHLKERRGGRAVRDSDSPSISGISAGFLSLFAVVGRHAGRA